MHSIRYGTKNIKFEIDRKSTLKNTYINVNASGVLVKTNNSTNIKDINQMVLKKSFWINKKLDVFKKIAVNKNITTGARLYYLGKSYYVNIVKNKDTKNITINFTHSKFNIATPLNYTDTELNNAIEYFYKQKAIGKITPLIKKWSKKMEVSPEYVSFRYSKNRWGSCSSTNRISLNYHLVKLHYSLIEYVVIHELTHIIYQNHSKNFWKMVGKYLVDYKVREEKIKIFERMV